MFTTAHPEPSSPDPRNFSIVLGGPLYQLLRRAHVSGDALELLHRRLLMIVALAWVPLLILTIIAGDALGTTVAVPFLKDFETHVRFLVALPLLIVAELVVHLRMRPIVGEFLVRGLVQPDVEERFRACLASAIRLRNSVLAEVLMIAAVYVFGVPIIWRELTALNESSWFVHTTAAGQHVTLAGFWYGYVGLPLFQFLLLRWYFRLLVWTRFLWQVSRIPLAITAMHSDRMGGLGFLTGTVYAFIPLAMAHGALLSGTIANRIFYLHEPLADSAVAIGVVLVFLLLLVLGPLTVFAPRVANAQRTESRVYGRLAQRYAREFQNRWLPGGLPAGESPLGSSDIQSLADLSNAYETIKGTRPVPITKQTVVALVIATLIPIAPLLLTVIPAKELAQHLLKLVL